VTNYGPHNDLVSAFLEQVRAADLEAMRALAAAIVPSDLRVDATRAIADARLSASVRTSVHSAAVKTFRELGLRREDFPGRRDLPRVDTAISTASTAIAAQEQLSPEHLHALLDPFAEVGFTAARTALGQH